MPSSDSEEDRQSLTVSYKSSKTGVSLTIDLDRPNKKNIVVFRVTGPYLNLLVKPRIFSGFIQKNITLCILKC